MRRSNRGRSVIERENSCIEILHLETGAAKNSAGFTGQSGQFKNYPQSGFQSYGLSREMVRIITTQVVTHGKITLFCGNPGIVWKTIVFSKQHRPTRRFPFRPQRRFRFASQSPGRKPYCPELFPLICRCCL